MINDPISVSFSFSFLGRRLSKYHTGFGVYSMRFFKGEVGERVLSVCILCGFTMQCKLLSHYLAFVYTSSSSCELPLKLMTYLIFVSGLCRSANR